ncbi:MAG: hypothetical protein ACREJC_16915 [Tepidisphaeraceae bacterium]
MTIFESGILAGIPAGAVVGGALGNAHGAAWLIAGLAVGVVSGALAGWLYALFVIVLLSFIAVLWRAARGRKDQPPTDAELKLENRTARRGVIVGVLIALGCWLSFGWVVALIAAVAIGMAVALLAVARCELRPASQPGHGD